MLSEREDNTMDLLLKTLNAQVIHTALTELKTLASGDGRNLDNTRFCILGSEFIRPKYRAFSYFALTMGYSIGYSLMAPIAFFLRDWRWFERATNVIGIFFVPYIWWVCFFAIARYVAKRRN